MIEDVVGDGGDIYRRLVFLSNQNIVQSEAKLKRGKIFMVDFLRLHITIY